MFKLHNIDLYQLLGSAPEVCLDNLVGLAAQIGRTPIAFLSLIDGNRHWLKSQLGIDQTLADSYLDFCDRAIDRTPKEFALGLNSEFGRAISLQKPPLVPESAIEPPANSFKEPPVAIVRDASTDVGFAEHPLTVSYPFVKFYAGIPVLTSDGQMLGVLSVMDSVPRDLTKETIEAIEALGRQVASLVDLRWQLLKAQKQPEVEDITSDSQLISELVRGSNRSSLCGEQMPQSGTRIYRTKKLPALRETGKSPYLWENSAGIGRYPETKQTREIVAGARDTSERQPTAASLQERSRLGALQAKVSAALGQGGKLSAILNRCTEAMVEYLDATGASIWTFNPQTERLELQANSGLSSEEWAREREDWVRAEPGKLQTAPVCLLSNPSLCAIAYPLIVEERLVGVMVLCSSALASEGALEVLGCMANAIAVALDRHAARGGVLWRRAGRRFGLARPMRTSRDRVKLLD
ncbi:MAG: hypothetical protein KY448_14180, partial [Cyanobacteria bacterium 0813]|nr:hypothetical protein [Cyanobacteria bacterium 0813]